MRSVPRKKRETGLFKEVWTAHNDLIEYVRQITPLQSGSQGVQIDVTSNGALFRVRTGKDSAAAGRVVRMRVNTVYDDYIACTNLDDSEALNVAKPFNLRKTGWHGESIVYTLEPYPNAQATVTVAYDMPTSEYRIATIGGYVEHQVIRPKYRAGVSIIFAAQCEDSGVSLAPEWIDLNADARAWTMVL